MSKGPIRIAIGLCTFRRPQLRETLESLAGLQIPDGVSLRIIIADNDEGPSAEVLVAEFAARAALPVSYIHAPARNISVARNAVLAAGEGDDFLAFIDDDETAAPDWIALMLAQMASSPAPDVVLGPVRAIYADDAPGWMKAARAHDTLPVVTAGGVIRTGYTCNVLLRGGAPALAGLRFDPALGRSGGEDTAFFASAFARGARFDFAPDAWLTEPVPPARAKLGWLIRRRFRMGQTHGGVLAERAPSAGARFAQAAKAGAKALACGGMAMVQLPFAARRNRALMRGALHVGAVAALAGLRPITLYGETPGPAGLPGQNGTT